MTLDPGYYKIQEKNGVFAKTHLLVVKIEGREKYLKIDNGDFYLVSKDDERHELQSFKVVKKLTRTHPLRVIHPDITVSFQDEDGDRFEFRSRTKQRFLNTLRQFPRLDKELDP